MGSSESKFVEIYNNSSSMITLSIKDCDLMLNVNKSSIKIHGGVYYRSQIPNDACIIANDGTIIKLNASIIPYVVTCKNQIINITDHSWNICIKITDSKYKVA